MLNFTKKNARKKRSFGEKITGISVIFDHFVTKSLSMINLLKLTSSPSPLL
jgi:hypothetical protein